MNPERITVCTTTFYPQWKPHPADVEQMLESGDKVEAEHKIRGDLALETALAVLRKGFRLVLIDGGKGSAFRDALAERGIPFTEEAARGMSASRRQAFEIAYADPAVDAVAWIEPEKVGMVEEMERCVEPVLTDEAAIVIPARTDAGWDSLPAYQRGSEREGNRVFNDKLHRAGLLPNADTLDMYFGPRIYSARKHHRSQLQEILRRRYTFDKHAGVPLHAAVNPGAYAEATFFPPVAALHEGLPVRSVPTGFAYPEQQRKLEEHTPFAEGKDGYQAKRRTQLVGILTELVNYLRFIGRTSGDSRLDRLS
jgi:hypothetical protein